MDVGVIEDAAASGAVALSADSPEGVYVVPAFSGLGAPYWDGRARGTVVGLTQESRRAHLVRATLESVAFRTRDVVESMAADSRPEPELLRVDGAPPPTRRSVSSRRTRSNSRWCGRLSPRRRRWGRPTPPGWRPGSGRRSNNCASSGASTGGSSRYDRWGEAVGRARDWAREE